MRFVPLWDKSWELHTDHTAAQPENSGLFPLGAEELSRREDVLGNVKTRYSCAFMLRRAAVPGEENARWLLELQNWTADQDRMGLAPKFGDEPKTERIRAFEGRLEKHTQSGSAMYTVQLTAEFTKSYEVK